MVRGVVWPAQTETGAGVWVLWWEDSASGGAREPSWPYILHPWHRDPGDRGMCNWTFSATSYNLLLRWPEIEIYMRCRTIHYLENTGGQQQQQVTECSAAVTASYFASTAMLNWPVRIHFQFETWHQIHYLNFMANFCTFPHGQLGGLWLWRSGLCCAGRAELWALRMEEAPSPRPPPYPYLSICPLRGGQYTLGW